MCIRDSLLADQRAFYRQRAPEYDEWWQHRGRYDRDKDMARCLLYTSRCV